MSENEDKGDRQRAPAVAGADCTSRVATNASPQNLLQYRQGVVHSVAGSKLTSMDIGKLEIILKKFVNTTGGVQDAVLVSGEAELINNPMQGWDEKSVMEMALVVLYSAKKTREHLDWSLFEQMWLQGEDSYFIGVRCNSDIFLLVKAVNDGPFGALRMAINGTVEKIQVELYAEESSILEVDNGAASARSNSKAAPEIDRGLRRKAAPQANNEITYRGRKSPPS